jgi:hypothetical protein
MDSGARIFVNAIVVDRYSRTSVSSATCVMIGPDAILRRPDS